MLGNLGGTELVDFGYANHLRSLKVPTRGFLEILPAFFLRFDFEEAY